MSGTFGKIKSNLQISAGQIVRRNLDDTGWECVSPSGGIESNPPSGKCKITNIYVNPTTGKCVVEYDNTPV